MKNYLILHGHFYQPPRENPWTGIVDTQDSAAPFHDWNARITRECYAANAASRFLHFDGRIEDIVNNYRILSFNFGPTLMWWLKKEAVHVYEAILEADRLSIDENNGHGNAIAQSYNHTILPLDDPEDARIQIRWGLRDFEYHFGRPSEGIWLPETGINEKLVDILLEEGVKYVILSPWQAEAVCADGSEEWEELGSRPAPFNHAYRIERPAGSMAVFFYNQDLAQGLSFDHYLRSADALYSRLLTLHNNANPGHLIHTATDGEVYGHHEAFGDMCLAALQKHIHQGKKFTFTNYGNYLEMFPPTHRARLRPGEAGLGSSWSCHHGVSRWYKDCGCSTGGKKDWNQQWRSSLREGLQALSGDLRSIFRTTCGELSSDAPEQLLDDYIRVLTQQIAPEDFARHYLKKDFQKKEGIASLLTLLEGQKYRLYSFTSCGWFFSDLGGIETIQNIRYALKAIELYRPFTTKNLMGKFSKNLENARSNLVEIGSGGDIINREIELMLPDGLEAASYYFLLLLMYNRENTDRSYGYFSLDRIHGIKRRDKHLEATVDLNDTTRYRDFSFHLTALTDEKGNFSLRAEASETSSGNPAFPEEGIPNNSEIIKDLRRFPKELRQKLSSFLVSSTEESIAEYAAQTFEETRFAVVQAELLGVGTPSIITRTAEISVSTLLYRYLDGKNSELNKEKVAEMEELLEFAAEYSISIDLTRVSHRLTGFLWHFFDRLNDHLCSEECEYLGRFIAALRKAGIEPELTIPQKLVFSHLSRRREELYPKPWEAGSSLKPVNPTALKNIKKARREELARLVQLCDTIGIYADDIKLPMEKLKY